MTTEQRTTQPKPTLARLPLCLAALLLAGCVTTGDADLIRARMAQKTHDMLIQTAAETEMLGTRQVTLDRDRSHTAILGAYRLDMRESVEAGDVNRAFQTVDKRDEKLTEMEQRLASKASKYSAVAAKNRIGAAAILAVDSIAQKQSEATAKAWKGFLQEDLPAAAGELVSSYASAKAAAEAAANAATPPAAPEPDPTDVITEGSK